MAPRKPSTPEPLKSVLNSILQMFSNLGRATKLKPSPHPASPSHIPSTIQSKNNTTRPSEFVLESILRTSSVNQRTSNTTIALRRPVLKPGHGTYSSSKRVAKSKPPLRPASPSHASSTDESTISITMAPRKLVLTSVQRTYTNPGRVTMSKPPPHPIKEPSDAYRMRLYGNGLLNLEDTPPHPITTVEHNAKPSLLSLPPEIRNRIWSLACGGHLVTVLNRCNGTGKTLVKAGAIRGTFDSTITLEQYDFMKSVDYCWPQSVPSVSRLPEVCRQIYFESALTSYNEKVFHLYSTRCMEKLLELSRAQKNAITVLEASPSFLAELVEPYDGMMYFEFDDDIDLFKRRMVKDFTADTVSGGLPNFRTLVVKNLAMRYARSHYDWGWEWEDEGREIIDT